MSDIEVRLDKADYSHLADYQKARQRVEPFHYDDLFALLDSIAYSVCGAPAYETEDGPDTCTLYFACEDCPQDWESEANSSHSEDCPRCGKAMEPYFTDIYADEEPRHAEVQAAYTRLPHRS